MSVFVMMDSELKLSVHIIWRLLISQVFGLFLTLVLLLFFIALRAFGMPYTFFNVTNAENKSKY